MNMIKGILKKKRVVNGLFYVFLCLSVVVFIFLLGDIYISRMDIIRKPILYLYPEKDMNVSVTFDDPSKVFVSYPEFKNEWNVKVTKNGNITDETGRSYYALYWEEKENKEVDFSEGFYVESKDAIFFLEEKLDQIGLNEREANEFIMYWLPIMQSNKKNLVYFELTDEKQETNKLIIEPKVDSLLRLTMHVKKVNKKVDIKEQKLEKFERKGFTAVEWGGVDYSRK